MSEPTLRLQLEAILFVADAPVTVAQLAAATGHPTAAIEPALAELSEQLQGGIRLSELGGRYRLVSAPGAAAVVRKFLQTEQGSDLSRAALETLAIVAYRGPLTKSHIEQLRGVASDATIRNLLGRGLITEAGKSPDPGRPMRYGVSHRFMQHFGLTSPRDLPPLPEDIP